MLPSCCTCASLDYLCSGSITAMEHDCRLIIQRFASTCTMRTIRCQMCVRAPLQSGHVFPEADIYASTRLTYILVPASERNYVCHALDAFLWRLVDCRKGHPVRLLTVLCAAHTNFRFARRMSYREFLPLLNPGAESVSEGSRFRMQYSVPTCAPGVANRCLNGCDGIQLKALAGEVERALNMHPAVLL